MQQIFDSNKGFRSFAENSNYEKQVILHKFMSAILTTESVFENSFRKAYLVTPVYKYIISNRKVLRERYSAVGCELDWIIRQVRALLEK